MYLYRFDRNTVRHPCRVHAEDMHGRPGVRDSAQHNGQQQPEIVCQINLHFHCGAEDTEDPGSVWRLVEHMFEIFPLW